MFKQNNRPRVSSDSSRTSPTIAETDEPNGFKTLFGTNDESIITSQTNSPTKVQNDGAFPLKNLFPHGDKKGIIRVNPFVIACMDILMIYGMKYLCFPRR